LLAISQTALAGGRQTIKAVYIPSADHYAGIVAYEKYAPNMVHAEYEIKRVNSWPLLRSTFVAKRVDVAFIICPQAMDMFREQPNFRWVSLMHRDGNAMAVNDVLARRVTLADRRLDRKPTSELANTMAMIASAQGEPTLCGVPSLFATHTVILYKYLKDRGMTLGLGAGGMGDVRAIAVPPPKSPMFLRIEAKKGNAASFEQSLPWADVVETGRYGKVAWYSKDVLPWPHGHVECIMIASDDCIRNKREALTEVIRYIHKAGVDIDEARQVGGSAMIAIADMIRKHIPEHNQEAIVQSLRPDLMVINYRQLNVGQNAKDSLKQIMHLGLEAGVLRKEIDLDQFANKSFATEITEQAMDVDTAGGSGEMTEAMKAKIQGVMDTLRSFATNTVLVEAVKRQNAKRTPLAEIQNIDREWVAGYQEELARSLQANPAGRLLHQRVSSDPQLYSEAFLCDRQGAVVAEYPKTSDYWQGDEKKFTACYNHGSGRVFEGPLEFDVSTMGYSVQISIPVKEGNETIGVLIVGVRNLK
jgi:NitT/TauT family transport system substrate-binding protein